MFPNDSPMITSLLISKNVGTVKRNLSLKLLDAVLTLDACMLLLPGVFCLAHHWTSKHGVLADNL